MNIEIIFNEFAKLAESNDDYYDFGKHGIIEDVLAWFNIPSERFFGSSSAVHSKNLSKLHDFMVHQATNDQIKMVANICKKRIQVPIINYTDDAADHVFVSMPMNNDKCSFVEDIRDGIHTALNNTGNNAYFFNKDTHSENICNVMLEHIYNCKFLVADLSTQNPGVYYEAGYAKALGKTVIFTCNNAEFDNVHFDVKQTQIVFWNDKNDLSNKLAHQIDGLNLSDR